MVLYGKNIPNTIMKFKVLNRVHISHAGVDEMINGKSRGRGFLAVEPAMLPSGNPHIVC